MAPEFNQLSESGQWPNVGSARRSGGMNAGMGAEAAEGRRSRALAKPTGHAPLRGVASAYAKAKASKLEHSSTNPAAVSARNPSETKS